MIGIIATMATDASASPRSPNRLLATDSATKVCQRTAPWNTEVNAGPSTCIARASSGRSSRHSADIDSTDSSTAPPTPVTGTEARFARPSVSISSAGNRT